MIFLFHIKLLLIINKLQCSLLIMTNMATTISEQLQAYKEHFLEEYDSLNKTLLEELYDVYENCNLSFGYLGYILDSIKYVFESKPDNYDCILQWLIQTLRNIQEDFEFTDIFVRNFAHKFVLAFEDNNEGLYSLVFEKMSELSEKEWFRSELALQQILRVLNKKVHGGHLHTLLEVLDHSYQNDDFTDFDQMVPISHDD